MLFNGLKAIVFILLLLPAVSATINLWWLDNLTSLQLQWSLLAALIVLFELKYKRRYRACSALLYLILIVFNYRSLYLSPPAQQHYSDVLKIGQLNLQYNNPDLKRVMASLAIADLDILILQEVGDDQHQALNALKPYYAYSTTDAFSDAYPAGLAIFSRWPIVNKKIHPLPRINIKDITQMPEQFIIEAVIQSPNSAKPLQIFAIHPASPRNEHLWLNRNATLSYLSQQLTRSFLPHKIVIGDFNTSPWSGYFKQLSQSALLQNSATGFGYMPSWSYVGHSPALRMLTSAYIDHCLVSQSFSVLNKQYQDIEGSDHVMILTILGL
jgi:endonuclease/exonuclease/phosphatase (EEP) superfamily protein YafD